MKYNVVVRRITYATQTFEVEGRTKHEAESLALTIAHNYDADWLSEGDDYEMEGDE